MPSDPAKVAAAVQLQQLIARVDTALRQNDQDALERALDDLNDFRDTPFPDLRESAKRAHGAANGANMAQALQSLAAIVEELKPLGKVIDGATATAAAGKANLLVPKLAKKAEEALDKVVKLKQEIEALKQDADGLAAAVGNVHELGDIPGALDQVQAALEKLTEKLPKAKN